MAEFFCEYCGFQMKFLVSKLKLSNFNYTCPVCHTPCQGELNRWRDGRTKHD